MGQKSRPLLEKWSSMIIFSVSNTNVFRVLWQQPALDLFVYANLHCFEFWHVGMETVKVSPLRKVLLWMLRYYLRTPVVPNDYVKT